MHQHPIRYLGAVLAVLLLSACGGGTRTEVTFPLCHAHQLHLAPSFYGEAGGQFIQTFTFTNLGNGACQVRGWPTLRVSATSGRPVSVRLRRVLQGPPSAPPFRTVLLHPRGAASFDVYGADWNGLSNRPCSHTTAIVVTLPGAADTRKATVKMPDCGLFDIAPLIAGKTDRHAWSVVWRG